MSRPTADLYPRYSGYYRQLCRLPRRVRRQLQRQWRRSLSALALLLALGQAPALAANITVAPGIPPAINADGLCALIEAIDNANADAQTHTDCVAGNGADSIALPLGSTQSLTVTALGIEAQVSSSLQMAESLIDITATQSKCLA